MSYPGNPSLGDEIQQKILSTFTQTLDLAEEGRKEEALLGCDFIRRLDPLFEPAETLLARLEGLDGAVPVDDLRALMADQAEDHEPDSTLAQVDELFAGLDQGGDQGPSALELDAEDLELGGANIELGDADVQLDVSIPSEGPVSSDKPLEVDLDLSSFGIETAPPAAQSAPTPLSTPAPDPGSGPEAAPEPEPSPGSVVESAPEPPPLPDDSVPPGPEPEAALDRESEERVDQLLSEGQAAFEAAEYQSAIDSWSRIFLIDIDHPEANRRIELARKLKAEIERKLEETHHDALTALDDGELEVAADGFRKVLSLQPTHLAAQEHLDRLEAGEFVPEEDSPEASQGTDIGPTSDLAPIFSDSPEDDYPEIDPAFEEMMPPTAGGEPELAPAEDSPRGKASRRPAPRTVLVIAGLVLVVAVVAAWFLRSNWTRFFPNAGEEVVTAPQKPKIDPIVRAQGLHVAGNTAMAISQLRRLPPAHPQYAEAQALIAQWETVLEDDETVTGPSPEQLAVRDGYVARAREAFANREFLTAEEFFVLAAQAAPLEEGSVALQTETNERLKPLRSEIEIFRQGEWSYALRSLWAKYESDPGNPDVLRLMIDGYFNLGVRDLQRGDPMSASENLSEAASLAGNDAEIQRLLSFSAVYMQRSPDLLYRIFVKYLPFR
jgi:tetratricopeptide (TPR) repeat protein